MNPWNSKREQFSPLCPQRDFEFRSHRQMSHASTTVDWSNLFSLSEFAIKHLEYEYPEEVVESIVLNDTLPDEEVSILNQSDDIMKPFWVDFDDET